MRNVVGVIALVAAVMASAPAMATASGSTHYVAPNGDDSAAGSEGAPWRTLQKAADEVGPGDTVLVAPGTYAGFRLETSGTPGNPIVFRSEQRGEAVVDRPGPGNRHDSNVELETWEGSRTVSHVVIDGFEVKNAPQWGIDVRGHFSAHSSHVVIKHNHVHHNGVASIKTGIFFAFVDDVTVVNNNSHHNGEHGVYLSNSGDGFVVRRNKLHHNQRCGLHMNGDLSQGGDGVISDGLVDRNWIEENGTEGCAGINMDGITDVVVTNNVIVDNHGTGIALFRQDGGITTRRIEIVNNTVVQADDGRWNIAIEAGTRNVTLRNNILLTKHPWRGVIEMATPNVPGFDSDHNLVTGRFSVDDAGSVLSLAQWRSATGQDANSATTTIGAAFIDGQWRHEPGGVAEDAGVDAGTERGYDGVIRTFGAAVDIGAYETPYCGGARATIVGTAKRDTLKGTDGGDVIHALNSADFVDGRGGTDRICGGAGADHLKGSGGSDDLRGGAGPDLLVGGEAGDSARGGAGIDRCAAEAESGCELDP